MEQFSSSVEEISRVSEQQQRNDEQQCPSCAAELTETSVWMIAANETDDDDDDDDDYDGLRVERSTDTC